MDWFKIRLRRVGRCQANEIYIPLWIDLKSVIFNAVPFFDRIYIPLWIDLKSIDYGGQKRLKYKFTFHYGLI